MESGKLHVVNAVRAAEQALGRGDPIGLAAAYAELAKWDDLSRAHQARRVITELVLAHGAAEATTWVPIFMCALRMVLDALEREPCEPTTLNYAGILLYELLQPDAAAALFAAALRLEPDHPHARDNLIAARAHRGSTATLPGAFGSRLRTLAGRGRRTAKRAVPRPGLRLSLCMIVRDEEEMLPGCLSAVRDAVDEIIVVDTGSKDATVAIAESFGARVVHFPWNGSFADARNVSIEHATGDWVMYLDADEHLEPGDAPLLRTLLHRTWREGFYLVETNYTGGEGSGAAMTHMALRVWRNRPEYRFSGRVHEQKTAAMPMYLPERWEHTAIRVRHYGYLNHRIREREKSRRNIALLEREALENPSPFNDFNLGSELLALGRNAEAATLFDRAWNAVRELPGWQSIGYVPLLAARIARAHRQNGDHSRAIRATDESLATFTDHTDLVFEAALSHRALGNLEMAASLAERCLEIGDAPATYAATAGAGTFLALCLLAEIRAAQGRAEDAEELLRRSLRAHPEYVAPVLPLVSALSRRDAADADICAAVPESLTARLLAATACHETGRPGLAERWFSEVLAAQPGNSVARIGLAETLLYQRRFAEAAQIAGAEPENSSLKGAALESEMFALAVEGQSDRMLERLRESSSSAAPGCAELWRAWAGAIEGAPAPSVLSPESAPPAGRALEALLRVEQVDAFATLLPLFEAATPDRRARREFLGRIYFRRGYLASAADEWIAVVQEQPDADAMLGLAQVAIARGYRDDARGFAEAAVELDPSSVTARRLAAALAA